MTELLAAIGRALGLPGAYEVTERREVNGGAVDAATGRVAWVETRTDPPVQGHVPVEIDVRFAWDGRLHGVVVPYTYNPYFGCRVEFARWFGDSFVLIYREKHEMVLSRFVPPYAQQDYLELADRFVVDGDRVFYLDVLNGLLRGRTFPEMRETPSIEVAHADHGPSLRLERPGVVRIAELPRRSELDSDEAYEAAVAVAFAAGDLIELP